MVTYLNLKGTTERVLGIDPGTANLAYCFFRPGKDGDLIVTGKIGTERPLPVGLKVEALITQLAAYVEPWSPTLVVKEGPAYGMPMKAVEMGRIHQAIDRFAFERGIPLIELSPQSIRSFIGSKSKSDTKLRLFQKYGVEFRSEDEADAYATARAGIARWNGELKTAKEKAAEKRAARKAG